MVVKQRFWLIKINQPKQKKTYCFLQSLDNYYLDDKNRLFVHAGFTNMNGINAEYFPKMFYWDRTLWETAVALNENLKKRVGFIQED